MELLSTLLEVRRTISSGMRRPVPSSFGGWGLLSAKEVTVEVELEAGVVLLLGEE